MVPAVMMVKVIHRLNKYYIQVTCDLQMLEYTLDGATSPSASPSTPLSWDHIQQRIEQFLKQEQASSSFDNILGWVKVSIITSF
jgi:hypothetical protein